MHERIMNAGLDIIELERLTTQPEDCSYLPQRAAQFDYRLLLDLSPAAYDELLSRGWRRFGRAFFRPACRNCQECRCLRLPVADFAPSRSQRRSLLRNEQIRVIVQPPTVTRAHLELHNAYHADMHLRRGWPLRRSNRQEYFSSFIDGNWTFAREFLYYDGPRLVGVGLADITPTVLSSVYFFHDPEWRSESPGTFSIMQQMEYCLQHNLRHLYLGFCISGCPSMAYKANYPPHELLSGFPADNEPPVWLRPPAPK